MHLNPVYGDEPAAAPPGCTVRDVCQRGARLTRPEQLTDGGVRYIRAAASLHLDREFSHRQICQMRRLCQIRATILDIYIYRYVCVCKSMHVCRNAMIHMPRANTDLQHAPIFHEISIYLFECIGPMLLGS